MNLAVALTLVSLAATPLAEERRGVFAPGEMPSGALAVWGAVGYPELRAGMRQGLPPFEVMAQAGLDYRTIKVYGSGGVRSQVYQQGLWRGSLEISGGLYADAAKQELSIPVGKTAGLLVEAVARALWGEADPVSVFGYVRLPLEIPFSEAGATKAGAVLGVGGELAVTDDYFLSVLGGLGPQFLSAGSRSSARFLAEVYVGLGYRVF